MFGQAQDQHSARRGRARLLGTTLAVVVAASLALLGALADNALDLRRAPGRVRVALAGEPAPLTLPDGAGARSGGTRVIDRLLNRTAVEAAPSAPSGVALVVDVEPVTTGRRAGRDGRTRSGGPRRRDAAAEQPALALPRGERGRDEPDPMTDAAEDDPKDGGQKDGGKPQPAKGPGGRPAPNGDESYPDGDDRARDGGDDEPKKQDAKAQEPASPGGRHGRPGPKGRPAGRAAKARPPRSKTGKKG